MIPQKKMWKKSRIHQTMVSQRWFFVFFFFSYERGMGFMRFLANVMVKPFWDGVWINLGMVHLAANGATGEIQLLLNVTLWDISDLPW